MNEEKQSSQIFCLQCGAELPDDRAECWLCGADKKVNLAMKHTVAAPAVSFLLSTLMLIMTLACVCFGLLAIAPGLGVFVCVILLPVFVRTSLVLKKREEQGIATPQFEKVLLFIVSFFVASSIVVIVLVTAFLSFCAGCWVSKGELDFIGTIVLAGSFAVTIWMIVMMSQWIAERYRRDVQG